MHTVKATSANVHDVRMTPELLHREEETVNGDSGYVGAEKREDAIIRNKKGKKIRYQINRRPSQIRKLSKSGQYKARKREHAKSSIRVKVEHVFGVVKCLLKFKKTRYRGLRKQAAKVNIMFALVNLILTVMLAFAEYERGTIVERTQTGKAIARQDPNFKDGRPKKFTAEQISLALSLLEQGKTYRQITSMTGISKSTLIRAKQHS